MKQEELKNSIVEIIGESNFEWLAKRFSRETKLEDVPDEIVERISSVNITLRDYAGDSNAVTAIALITFSYMMAGKVQEAKHGPNDIALVKVLFKNERSRRKGEPISRHRAWGLPLFELITGEVGEKIRSLKLMANRG
ncbi:MAG: hypothetical protein JRI79_07865 [Deltaproteobacteria bacterium]|nr:hypothetical protein [Deltaproteobacteria bacterium]MBW1934983.1 hypothetical protein [Deltaproteobacteria bacterium]MBW1977871.1 hypothetical protein [Deltaproteobacteria bacterium]MBW2046407.1 hypothetical protein [Deltaproteobacteria bacterium]MBW2300609.1 hypothetical protein [Deltaproteobacteria bacterium]